MTISIGDIENDLASGKLTLSNIKGFEDIKARVADRGVTDENIAELLRLHDESVKACDKYKEDFSAQIGLSIEFDRKEKESGDLFTECIEIARLAFEDNPGIMKLLGLTGKRSKAINVWTVQALRFFKEALTSEEILQGLAKYNLTKEDLEKGQKSIEELLDAKYKLEEQKGKAQTSYKERDKVYRLFRKPMRHIRKLLRIEYKKDKQQLERLGIRVYSDGYVKAETRRKKEEKKKKEQQAGETQNGAPAPAPNPPVVETKTGAQPETGTAPEEEETAAPKKPVN